MSLTRSNGTQKNSLCLATGIKPNINTLVTSAKAEGAVGLPTEVAAHSFTFYASLSFFHSKTMIRLLE